MLDVQVDYKGWIIYTVPEESAIYMIENDNIIHVASLEIRKYFSKDSDGGAQYQAKPGWHLPLLQQQAEIHSEDRPPGTKFPD